MWAFLSLFYWSFGNAESGLSFVMNLIFSHTLSPSAQFASQLAFDLLKTLAPKQRQELKAQLSLL
jgi:hypothetical protein